ncbi:MAG TPA: polymer-forming cytoskeletal protein, partial [Firmicutes bacterium]|nr:polymer-forming cytoskeletal protein [Bacillota bacterium]
MTTQNEAGGQMPLLELIFREYERDRKQERISYRVIAFIRRLFSKGEEIPVTHGGYLEDGQSVRILESLKAREITSPENKVLIVAREGRVFADIKGSLVYVAGEANGDIKAERIYVKGTVEGVIEAEHVEIFPGGQIKGHVRTARLLMHKKG